MGACKSFQRSDGSKAESSGLACMDFTEIPSSYFDNPVPVAMSGGTAQFFNLEYIGPSSGADAQKYGKSATYWLGKDVERALDELPFYEDLMNLDLDRYKLLRDWTMEYVGILNAHVHESHDSDELEDEARNLLVIHDIADGLTEKRMLDIKIGSETAVAGWRGKSKQGAMGNRAVDHVTNSENEGYRLEGFDHQPACLQSQSEDSRACGCLAHCKMLGKKQNRLSLQMLPLRDFARYWDDFNDLEDFYTSQLVLSPVENGEALLFDAVRQIAQMCVDAQDMLVPQMWIGSSLCMACDSGELLERRSALSRLSAPRPPGRSMQPADLAKVCVFDWGRSELNTIAKHQALDSAGKDLRTKYWVDWRRGILRACFEATCVYMNQFCFEPETITIEAWDFDTFDDNDLLGTVEIPVRPTAEPETYEFTGGWHSGGEVTVEVEEIPVPSPSRFQKMWRVYVHGVEGLPRSDLLTDTDPLIRVKIGSGERGSNSRCDTPVIWDDRNAEIQHPLYFGMASPQTQMATMERINTIFGANMSPSMFKFDEDEAHRDDAHEQRFEAFLDALPQRFQDVKI